MRTPHFHAMLRETSHGLHIPVLKPAWRSIQDSESRRALRVASFLVCAMFCRASIRVARNDRRVERRSDSSAFQTSFRPPKLPDIRTLFAILFDQTSTLHFVLLHHRFSAEVNSGSSMTGKSPTSAPEDACRSLAERPADN